MSGPHGRDQGNAAVKRGREPAPLSDSDAVPSDLLSQAFCWLTFSHWTTNSVNCGRAYHTNEKQGTAALFASQKSGCLQWFQTQPSSSQGSSCIARTERKSSQGKAEVWVSVSISTTHGVMKGTYTLLNPSTPLIWSFLYASVSTVLATERIYRDHNHSCLHSPSSQHRPGTQLTIVEYHQHNNGN